MTLKQGPSKLAKPFGLRHDMTSHRKKTTICRVSVAPATTQKHYIRKAQCKIIEIKHIFPKYKNVLVQVFSCRYNGYNNYTFGEYGVTQMHIHTLDSRSWENAKQNNTICDYARYICPICFNYW